MKRIIVIIAYLFFAQNLTFGQETILIQPDQMNQDFVDQILADTNRLADTTETYFPKREGDLKKVIYIAEELIYHDRSNKIT